MARYRATTGGKARYEISTLHSAAAMRRALSGKPIGAEAAPYLLISSKERQVAA